MEAVLKLFSSSRRSIWVSKTSFMTLRMMLILLYNVIFMLFSIFLHCLVNVISRITPVSVTTYNYTLKLFSELPA